MGSTIKLVVQFLATEKEVEIEKSSTIESLKSKIMSLFSIPVGQQSLMLNGRNIGTSSKSVVEIGLEDGSVVVVKKLHRIDGTSRGGMGAFMKNNPMMKSILKNPSSIKAIKEMFPDLKKEMEENSSLNALMSNEYMEEELERLTGNDDYMKTQMKNIDITMAKLQNLPEGVRIMNSMAKDTSNLTMMRQPASELKGTHQILTAKNNKAIPGKNTVNYLIEYRRQLLELKNIGFENVRENIEVLRGVNGDLELAQAELIRRYGVES